MNLLRVGRISALNMYPLFHGLEGIRDPTLAFTDGLPTTLNQLVLDGALDISAMSSIAYARHAERLRLLPVASVTADGAVDTIQLFSRVPFDEVRTVAVPRHALHTPFAPHNTDLAAEWRARTGLPMVFAVWAARADTATERPEALAAFEHHLRTAREAYLADPESVVRAAARRFPFPAEFIRPYLRRLSYDFSASERAGLAEFLSRATAVGELAALPTPAA